MLSNRNITRYTVDGNTVPPADRRYSPARVLHIVRRAVGVDQWRVDWLGSMFNFRTEQWEDEYAYRHAEDPDAYFTTLEKAAELAELLAVQPEDER